MSAVFVTDTLPPSFGGRWRTDEYYSAVTNIIRILKGKSSLRIIAQHLDRQGFTTPRGMPFNRDRLVRFIKSNPL